MALTSLASWLMLFIHAGSAHVIAGSSLPGVKSTTYGDLPACYPFTTADWYNAISNQNPNLGCSGGAYESFGATFTSVGLGEMFDWPTLWNQARVYPRMRLMISQTNTGGGDHSDCSASTNAVTLVSGFGLPTSRGYTWDSVIDSGYNQLCPFDGGLDDCLEDTGVAYPNTSTFSLSIHNDDWLTGVNANLFFQLECVNPITSEYTVMKSDMCTDDVVFIAFDSNESPVWLTGGCNSLFNGMPVCFSGDWPSSFESCGSSCLSCQGCPQAPASPTPTAQPYQTPTSTSTPTPSASVSPSHTPTPSVTPSSSPTPTATPTSSPSASMTPAPSAAGNPFLLISSWDGVYQVNDGCAPSACCCWTKEVTVSSNSGGQSAALAGGVTGVCGGATVVTGILQASGEYTCNLNAFGTTSSVVRSGTTVTVDIASQSQCSMTITCISGNCLQAPGTGGSNDPGSNNMLTVYISCGTVGLIVALASFVYCCRASRKKEERVGPRHSGIQMESSPDTGFSQHREPFLQGPDAHPK